MGWLACPVPNQWCFSASRRIFWFGKDFEPDLIYDLVQVKHIGCACNGWQMWIACRWPSLLRLVHLGIHRDLVIGSLSFHWLQAVLLEDHYSCFKDKKQWIWNDVRPGNKVILIRGVENHVKWFLALEGSKWKIRDELLPKERWLWLPSTLVVWLACFYERVWKVVTWLILPVVICLSQRLSHACLSINNFVLWNCEWLIKSVIVYLMLNCYMDNCGNSRANTCNQAPTSGRGVFIR